jgi:hypothetical protein
LKEKPHLIIAEKRKRISARFLPRATSLAPGKCARLCHARDKL